MQTNCLVGVWRQWYPPRLDLNRHSEETTLWSCCRRTGSICQVEDVLPGWKWRCREHDRRKPATGDNRCCLSCMTEVAQLGRFELRVERCGRNLFLAISFACWKKQWVKFKLRKFITDKGCRWKLSTMLKFSYKSIHLTLKYRAIPSKTVVRIQDTVMSTLQSSVGYEWNTKLSSPGS